MFYNRGESGATVCGEGGLLHVQIYIVHQMLQMERSGLCLLINFIAFFISIKSAQPS